MLSIIHVPDKCVTGGHAWLMGYNSTNPRSFDTIYSVEIYIDRDRIYNYTSLQFFFTFNFFNVMELLMNFNSSLAVRVASENI